MYTVHHDAVLLPLAVSSAEWYRLGTDSVPAVSASASRDRAGLVHVTMSNLDPSRSRTAAVDVRGLRASGVTGRILTAPSMNGHNTFERPDAVKPVPFGGARLADGQLAVTLPPRSVVVLELR
jgi:alpha-N-arabinofuranosidase